MPLFRKQQTTDGRGSVLVAEFTTSQAVMCLCAALVLLGAAFVAGRLVAHVDRPIDIAAKSAVQETGAVAESAPSPTPPPPKEAATPTAPIQTGPQQTYTIPAMEAGAGTPAPSAPPQSATAPSVKATAAPTTVAAASTLTAANASPAPAPASSASAPTATAPANPASSPVPVEEAAPVPTPVAAAPPPVQMIPVPPVSQPAAPAKSSPLLASTKPRLTDLPPLPSHQDTPTPAPVRVEKPAAPEAQPIQVASAATAASSQIAPSDPPATETPATNSAPPVKADTKNQPPSPITPPSPGAVPASAPGAKSKTVSAADKSSTAAKAGGFAVQLGSFDGPQRQSKAQSLQKRVKKDFGLNAQVENSDKERLSRVVLTGYADKSSAATACAELRKRSGMSGAFVRAL